VACDKSIDLAISSRKRFLGFLVELWTGWIEVSWCASSLLTGISQLISFCCTLVLRVAWVVLIVRRKLSTDYVDHEMEAQGLGQSACHEDR